MTVGRTDNPGNTERDFFGVTMFWSHFESTWYVTELESLGFEILRRAVLGHGLDRHPVLFARVSAGSKGSAF